MYLLGFIIQQAVNRSILFSKYMFHTMSEDIVWFWIDVCPTFVYLVHILLFYQYLKEEIAVCFMFCKYLLLQILNYRRIRTYSMTRYFLKYQTWETDFKYLNFRNTVFICFTLIIMKEYKHRCFIYYKVVHITNMYTIKLIYAPNIKWPIAFSIRKTKTKLINLTITTEPW